MFVLAVSLASALVIIQTMANLWLLLGFIHGEGEFNYTDVDNSLIHLLVNCACRSDMFAVTEYISQELSIDIDVVNECINDAWSLGGTMWFETLERQRDILKD